MEDQICYSSGAINWITKERSAIEQTAQIRGTSGYAIAGFIGKNRGRSPISPSISKGVSVTLFLPLSPTQSGAPGTSQELISP